MTKFGGLLLAILSLYSTHASAFIWDTRAKWVNSREIELQLPPGFYVSADTKFFLANSTSILSGSQSIELPFFAHKNGKAVLGTQHIDQERIDELIRGPLRVVVSSNSKNILDSTSIQYAGLLDQYYFSDKKLGADCHRQGCDLNLWAPTAENVRLILYRELGMTLDKAEILMPDRDSQGVWSLNLSSRYLNYYYQYEVRVYQPLTGQMETYLVTDPYSFSLSQNGQRSQLVDLTAAETKPSGWDQLRKPELQTFKDAIIYELHIRDYSSVDVGIAPEYRGTYLAFSHSQTLARQYLKDLADAGLTYVHLLPFNDFGTVNEDKSTWESYLGTGRDLQEAQTIIGGQRATDSFNWGYDPVHYFAPEGSYAVEANGASRIKEVRQMVQSLNGDGLRVIQDMVFNHTYESGVTTLSVFDKIVPQYYFRLDENGKVHNTSCCNDTASENRMMERLMIDAVTFWARTYKIYGFRFDLMNFHSLDTMENLRLALRHLTLEDDGVDGSQILLYGEGWSFGSYYERYPTLAMTVENSYGTNYGFFNDRLRDTVRGGTTNSVEKSDQGFATGLYFDFNHEPANRNTPVNLEEQKGRLLHYGDVIKAGLAGNLRDFYFRDHLGSTTTAGDLIFRGAPVAFASQAIETANYISAHDGYGVWDAIRAKAPFYAYGRDPGTASVEERQRMHQLALSIPMLGQGIPFIESATELLRSKNGDQDSYDSGDFFNRIDWSGQTNHWGTALPPAWKNLKDWQFWEPRLREPSLQVAPSHIQQTKNYFKALLRLRQSSDLFKMNTLSEITQHLHFIDNDAQPEPGLIAMLLSNPQEELLIIFNSSKTTRSFQHDTLRNQWKLHPLFDEKVDPVLLGVVLSPQTGDIQIPGRSTVVLQLSTKK